MKFAREDVDCVANVFYVAGMRHASNAESHYTGNCKARFLHKVSNPARKHAPQPNDLSMTAQDKLDAEIVTAALASLDASVVKVG